MPDPPILAGSRRVKERLADHNGFTPTSRCSAHIDETFSITRARSFESPLCIGRHEFPKRTELFLHAISTSRVWKGACSDRAASPNG